MPLDQESLAQIREIIREEINQPMRTDRILTLAEARVYVKKRSPRAFHEWCTRRHVTSVSPGRYARSQLDRALEKEASKIRQPKAAPRRKTVI